MTHGAALPYGSLHGAVDCREATGRSRQAFAARKSACMSRPSTADARKKDLDGRDKHGHDEGDSMSSQSALAVTALCSSVGP
jgi:hypothetical protein